MLPWKLTWLYHWWTRLNAIIRIRNCSGPYFPAFGLNAGGKIGTRITPNTDTFTQRNPWQKNFPDKFYLSKLGKKKSCQKIFMQRKICNNSLSHFVITDTLCNNSLSLCNKITLPYFVIRDHIYPSSYIKD